MEQDHHISSGGPVSSCFMSQQVNPSFGSSSLSTASSYSFFGSSASTSSGTRSQTISFPPNLATSSSFGSSSASSPFSPQCTSFSSTSSPSFYSEQSPFSNISSASAGLSSNASNDHSSDNGSSEWENSWESCAFATPTPTRMKYWKNRDHLRETPANQLKNRRDEFVAKFRGLDLSDDFEDEHHNASSGGLGLIGPDWQIDPARWEALGTTPPRYEDEDETQWQPPPRVEAMKDPDEETIEDDDGWGNWNERREIILEPLINISDPDVLLCPSCKQFSLKKVSSTLLECDTCAICPVTLDVDANCTILMIKQRLLQCLRDHESKCPANFSRYSVNAADDIELDCETCDKSYNVTKEFRIQNSEDS